WSLRATSSALCDYTGIFLDCSAHHRVLHSFPTRRSSDLVAGRSWRTKGLNHWVWVAILTTLGLVLGQWIGRAQLWTDPLAEDKRSEEHTSELQSRSDLVCRLLLEKKKKTSSTNAASTRDP